MTEEAERKIFSLSQITSSLENFVLKHFGSKSYWITAEIAKVSSKGGHHYFELVETQNWQLLAQVQANFWYSNYRKARDTFGPSLDEILQQGHKALFLVRIEYHKIFGLKLNILDVDPSFSYGEMERQKQLNIAKLKEENLFHLQKTLLLPRICRKIALIGSPDTSGFRDFMKTLMHNDFYTNFSVKVFPSSVQGNEAKEELLNQIKKVQNYDVDAVVLVRGGGSKTDLNIFNDYDICKAICLCKIPIVTGIGHETDDVVASHVSRLDCITPTAAAKHFYIQISSFLSELRSSFDNVIQNALVLLQAHQLEFYDAQKRLGYWSQVLLKKQQVEIDELSRNIYLVVHYNLVNRMQELDVIMMHLEVNVQKMITESKKFQLEGILEQIAASTKFQLDRELYSISQLDELLQLLNPMHLLQKGYTISTVNDEDLNQVKELKIKQEMKTLASNKLVTSIITNIENFES